MTATLQALGLCCSANPRGWVMHCGPGRPHVLWGKGREPTNSTLSPGGGAVVPARRRRRFWRSQRRGQSLVASLWHHGWWAQPRHCDRDCCHASGTWCSGITSASHAEGPGFKSQCVHARFCCHGSNTVSLPLPGVLMKATPPTCGRLRDRARMCMCMACVRVSQREGRACVRKSKSVCAYVCMYVCVCVSVCSINAPRAVASGLSTSEVNRRKARSILGWGGSPVCLGGGVLFVMFFRCGSLL